MRHLEQSGFLSGGQDLEYHIKLRIQSLACIFESPKFCFFGNARSESIIQEQIVRVGF